MDHTVYAGLKNVDDIVADKSTRHLFPDRFLHGFHLGCGFDPHMGQALAEECIALNVDVILGPGVNMKRTPLCGRNFEYYSEDPYLAGQMAASFINGVQSKGVGTSLKHFAANNQEYQRSTISSEVDERTLREIYLPPLRRRSKKPNPGR